MKVLLSVPLYPYTGYGRDGISLVDLFLDAGADVHLDPDGAVPPLSPRIAQLFTKPPGRNFDLQLKQYDPARLRSHAAEARNTRLYLGWTMWEWTHLDTKLSDDTIRKIPSQLEHLHALALYDQVSKRAVGPLIPMHVYSFVAQGGIDPKTIRQVRRDFRERPFKFVMYGALTPRKGPFYAVEAFKRLRQRRPDLDVELHLKSTEVGIHDQLAATVPGLYVHNVIWSQREMSDFLSRCHCLLAPSMGEGKNAAALEFLASGGAAIVTDWGGHQMWLDPSFAWPLRAEEVLEAPTRKACRAEPSIDHLTELMEEVIDNVDETQRRADVAARVVPQAYSWKATVCRMFERLANSPCEQAHVAHEVLQMLREVKE